VLALLEQTAVNDSTTRLLVVHLSLFTAVMHRFHRAVMHCFQHSSILL